MANYGKETLEGVTTWSLTGEDAAWSGAFDWASVPCGGLADIGTLRIPLHISGKAAKLTLAVELCGYRNAYSVWVYPDEEAVCPQGVYECRRLDEQALCVLSKGGTVFLAPDSTKEALPQSVRSQFSTDFWSVGTFPAQEGGMGLLIDAAHPVFEHFPTDTHTDWQWWPMASQRAVILPQALRDLKPIVAVMDSYAYLRPMAQLLECRCAGGRLLLSTLGLHNLQRYPEARALLGAIYRYMTSSEFDPKMEVSPECMAKMVR